MKAVMIYDILNLEYVALPLHHQHFGSSDPTVLSSFLNASLVTGHLGTCEHFLSDTFHSAFLIFLVL